MIPSAPSVQDVNSPKFQEFSTNDSNDNMPNMLDVNSSGEFKRRHKIKFEKRSTFFGKDNPVMIDESDSEGSP